MNKKGRKLIHLSTPQRNQAERVKQNNSSYVETRKGSKHTRIEFSKEQIAENEIILDMKDELHEFFRIDIVYCKDKIIRLIKELRKHKWTSIHQISDDYLIDIDRYALLKASEVTGVSVKNMHAQKLKEELLSDKFNLQIQEFRIENTHDLPNNQGSYEYKKAFKNNLLVGITNYNIKQVNRKGKKGQVIGNIEDWNTEYDGLDEVANDDDNWDEIEDQKEIEERKQDELFQEFLRSNLGIGAEIQESQGKVSSEAENKQLIQESNIDSQGITGLQSQSSTQGIANQSPNNDNSASKEAGYSQRTIPKRQYHSKSNESSTNKSYKNIQNNINNSNTVNFLDINSAEMNKQKQKKKIFLSEESSDEEEEQIQIKPIATSNCNNNSDTSELDFQWITQEAMVEEKKVDQFNQQQDSKQHEQLQECTLGGLSKQKESQICTQSNKKVQKYECIAIIDDDDEEEKEKQKEDKKEDEEKFNIRQINLNAQPYKKIKSNVI